MTRNGRSRDGGSPGPRWSLAAARKVAQDDPASTCRFAASASEEDLPSLARSCARRRAVPPCPRRPARPPLRGRPRSGRASRRRRHRRRRRRRAAPRSSRRADVGSVAIPWSMVIAQGCSRGGGQAAAVAVVSGRNMRSIRPGSASRSRPGRSAGHLDHARAAVLAPDRVVIALALHRRLQHVRIPGEGEVAQPDQVSVGIFWIASSPRSQPPRRVVVGLVRRRRLRGARPVEDRLDGSQPDAGSGPPRRSSACRLGTSRPSRSWRSGRA